MWSENSDEDIYITQSTFRQESNLDDVSDWFQDGSPTDGQVLNNNMENEKATAKNRFANPISEVEIQAKIGDAPNIRQTWYGCFNSALFERKEKDCETIQRR